MKRSLELLIAEQLQKDGFLLNISDAINHMNNKKYSYVLDGKSHDPYYIITVVFSEKIIVVYSVSFVDEKVNLITKK